MLCDTPPVINLEQTEGNARWVSLAEQLPLLNRTKVQWWRFRCLSFASINRNIERFLDPAAGGINLDNY
jgi:hypothetical protein